MAGGRIKGITIEIGGDTTKLESALKSFNAEIKNTESNVYLDDRLIYSCRDWRMTGYTTLTIRPTIPICWI